MGISGVPSKPQSRSFTPDAFKADQDRLLEARTNRNKALNDLSKGASGALSGMAEGLDANGVEGRMLGEMDAGLPGVAVDIGRIAAALAKRLMGPSEGYSKPTAPAPDIKALPAAGGDQTVAVPGINEKV